MSFIFLALTLFLISFVGIILYFFENISQKILHLFIALGAGTMLSVSLVHILPESLEESSIAIYAFIAGFLLIYLLEEILTPHTHDHHHKGHTHEDPHEHYHHIVVVAWIAIFLHTIFDGVGISAGFSMSESLGLSILSGVAIHQIPVSLSLASMLRDSSFHRKSQIILMFIFALAAPVGLFIADRVFVSVSPIFTSLATAFAGGSLLYVSNVELLPIIHSQTSKKMKYITVFLFSLGLIGMSLVALFE